MEKGDISLGGGLEHKVWQRSDAPDIVFKTPKKINAVLLNRYFGGVQKVRDELEEAGKTAETVGLKAPRTIIEPFGKNYMMAQEYIQDDHSVTDIDERLRNCGNEDFLTWYQQNPSNFASREGNIYWLDPTKGPIGRLLERFPKTERKMRKLLARERRVANKLGLFE